MPDIALPFSIAEYQDRLVKTRAAMVRANIDVLVVTDPANMSWLTGYDGWSFYVHQAVIVLPEGEPLWWGRPMDGVGARMTSYLAPESIHSYPDHYVQSATIHPYQLMAVLLRQYGHSSARIGLEMDNYYFTAKCFETLRLELPDAQFSDATALVNWQRAVKSEQELIYMRRAARIVEQMHQRIRDTAEDGLPKSTLIAEIYDASLRGADGFGGDYPSIVPLTPSGTDAAAAHLTWDDRPLRRGEGTFFEIAGCYRRYHCPMSRTIYLGEPPADMLRAGEAVLEGLADGLEVARPGNTCGEVADAFFAVLAKHGIEKNSRTGYAVGISYPPDWGERTMSLRPGDQSILEPNMTFHFMPGLWGDDWGFEVSETIRITEDGPAECLADVGRELIIKP
ncbi:ectoine hydrolase DoeA [Devosia rhodophyticola]|uniref:Ectoine hydrolase DoeA n=1 Tax=Devosia rhodophyticola TaxID=3026423 RepID=A0ABY7Z1K2_9HYPH|nr:ectoine hydrolase DoeA [Devosia rhodophyticola]WDR07090.1 ectoine hydrolase DoeA [Devosia rhodophyticola]